MATATTTPVKTRTIKQVLVTNRGQELLAQLGSEELAAAHYNHEKYGTPLPEAPKAGKGKKGGKKGKKDKGAKAVAPAPVADPVEALVASGKFTRAQALAVIGSGAVAEAPAPAATPAAEVSIDDVVSAHLEKQGFGRARGRVYVTPQIIEGAARVLKGKVGTHEIVASSGNGRTVAVAIWKTASGDASVQNLIKATLA